MRGQVGGGEVGHRGGGERPDEREAVPPAPEGGDLRRRLGRIERKRIFAQQVEQVPLRHQRDVLAQREQALFGPSSEQRPRRPDAAPAPAVLPPANSRWKNPTLTNGSHTITSSGQSRSIRMASPAGIGAPLS